MSSPRSRAGRTSRPRVGGRLLLLGAVALCGCLGEVSGEPGSGCGPSTGEVAQVIDGDTVQLTTGERIRYLMVDTPETTSGTPECYGPEARTLNQELVLGKTVTLHYDAECEDRYGRLLAYVEVEGKEVNRTLIERGYACVLFIAPNGEDRREEFQSLESAARAGDRGLWGFCPNRPC